MNFISSQQESIVLSPHKIKLIQGCAGSHKTDTLIKCAVHDLRVYLRPILFLTLVGSVTNEITCRLENALNIKIRKCGASNHFIGHYNKIPICISNFDAWVHYTLKEKATLIKKYHKRKVACLAEESENTIYSCTMKNGEKVGLLMVDEVQDLCPNQMKIIINIIRANPTLYVNVAGDYLQTLFLTELCQDMPHPMDLFRSVQPSLFTLHICMRCPRAHVDFSNFLLEDIHAKYILPPMESNNNNDIDKPFLFTHYKVTNNNNTDALKNAELIRDMIITLMKCDPDICENDIVVIMPKTNSNLLFEQLSSVLKNVIYMKTRGEDGTHSALDWMNAEGKIKLLSIHGDKGRGHKAVFLIGMTEYALPKKGYINTARELLSESLLNVGITRSLKYLFIGMNYTFPSRYLFFKKDKLLQHAYATWDWSLVNKRKVLPEPYQSIFMTCIEKYGINNKNPKQNLMNPIWNEEQYDFEKNMGGDKTDLCVKKDISTRFEETINVLPYPWEEEKNTFGHPMKGITQKDDLSNNGTFYELLGVMCELLIQRRLYQDALFSQLSIYLDESRRIFVKDEQFLSCAHDTRGFTMEELNDVYYTKHEFFFSKNKELWNSIKKITSDGKWAFPSIFKEIEFHEQMFNFMKPNLSNEELSPACIWNVMLFMIHVRDKEYRPNLSIFFGRFNHPINVIHNNVDSFIRELELEKESCECKRNIFFEKTYAVYGSLNDEERRILYGDKNKNKKCKIRPIFISGRYDMFDEKNQILYEIKASMCAEYSDEWLNQIGMYASLMEVYKIPVKKCVIVNILQGILWEWKIDTSVFPKIETVVEKISNEYHWHVVEKNALLRGIKELRYEFI